MWCVLVTTCCGDIGVSTTLGYDNLQGTIRDSIECRVLDSSDHNGTGDLVGAKEGYSRGRDGVWI